MDALVRLCLAAACLLFVVSLPLGSRPAGQALRRWAACFLVAAFTPALACALLQQTTNDGDGDGGVSLGGVLQVVGLLAILAVVAYVTLLLRGHLLPRRRDPSGQRRSGYRYNDPYYPDHGGGDDRPTRWRGTD